MRDEEVVPIRIGEVSGRHDPSNEHCPDSSAAGASTGAPSVSWIKAADEAGVYGLDDRLEFFDTLNGKRATESLGGNVTITGNEVKYTFPKPVTGKKFIRLKVTGL